jgi:hypothetical protein
MKLYLFTFGAQPVSSDFRPGGAAASQDMSDCLQERALGIEWVAKRRPFRQRTTVPASVQAARGHATIGAPRLSERCGSECCPGATS